MASLFRFIFLDRQIAASEAEAEREIISAIEKEFENISIVDTNQTKPDKSDEEDAGEIVNRRLNILFENKHVFIYPFV